MNKICLCNGNIKDFLHEIYKMFSNIFYFFFRYLDSCQVVGGLATPILDACNEEIQDTCTSFKREECDYTGKLVFTRTSVANAHTCQSLLTTIGYVYGGVYFVYDSVLHTCYFYDSTAATCSAFSGPDQPDLDDCQYVCRAVLV